MDDGCKRSARMTSDITTMGNFNSNYQGQLSEIQSFYKDMTVFLTGATGFIGNLILEKLIRTCFEVKRIYILVREKKGKSSEERFKKLFDNPIFQLMKKEQPNYLDKISAVTGDCELPDLGISEKYSEILKNEVNIIIHSAATVRFDEHLRKAVNINIIALRDILKLANEIKNLKSFVHISTAYSNCAGRKVVDEVFYKPYITGTKLQKQINCLDDDYISKITPELLKEWPNTYAMTKAIAENQLLTNSNGLPIGVIRPSMITATFDEPIPGWINNYYGPTGVVAAVAIGLMRCMLADPKQIADVVPGDYVSNAILACAWDVHNQWKEHNKNLHNIEKFDSSEDNKSFVPPIYNFVSSNTNPLTWGEFSSYNLKFGLAIPSIKLIWPVMLKITNNKYDYMITCFLLHTIPGLIIDFIAKLTGRKPRLMGEYKKLHKFAQVISYFSLQSWTFHDENTRSLISKLSKLDQSLFHFDMSKLKWDEYFRNHINGIRVHILNDPLETVPEGKKHNEKLYMLYYTVIALLVALFLLIIYGLLLLFLQ